MARARPMAALDAGRLPPDWDEHIRAAGGEASRQAAEAFVAAARARGPVYPAPHDLYRAFWLCPFASLRVVILGQDPYHGPAQAHGLAFSVPRGVAPPPSLRNIFRELADDLGRPPPEHGDLSAWASQGVLLLNTVLSVGAGAAHSHRGQGWEGLTDAVIDAVSAREVPAVFVLWGNPARKKRSRIVGEQHAIVEGPHPSPLSAHRGFFGSRPFSTVNAALAQRGLAPVDWA